jgi:hypothetical protein
MDKKNEIYDALEENLDIIKKPKSSVSNEEIIKDTESDVEYSRDKMKSLIDQSCEAIDQMMALASESEHPRAFEVLGAMIKHTSEMTQDLVKLQKSRQDITQQKNGPSSTTTNNSIFVGSTTELQKFLKCRTDDEEEKTIDVTE